MRQIISLAILLLLLTDLQSFGQPSIRLRKTFIDSFKNKVTITSQFKVWYSHHKANTAVKDGDIHCSGYDKKIGMPVVTEIMNAKDQTDAMASLIAHEGKGSASNKKIKVTGVWRLWPEHLGHNNFFQGMQLSKTQIKAKTTNPDHVFEIHPVTELEGFDLTASLMNIDGYEPKKAQSVFEQIKKKSFTISVDKKNISFSTKQIGNNYIDLWIRVDSLWEVQDGAFAHCTVLDSDFDPQAHQVTDYTVSKKTRVAFVKGSAPYSTALEETTGKFIHILGIPRINLALISWRAWASKKQPEVLTWRMPVEIIAAGIIE